MTTGKPASLILRFAIPLIIGNFLQQTYSIVDSLVVGNYIGKEALGAVGSTSPLTFLFISLFMGIGIGGTVVISQFFGAKNNERVQMTIETMYKAFIVISVILTILSSYFVDELIHLIGVPEEISGMAKDYIEIIFLGYIGLFGYNINNCILQGLGDSVSNVIYLTISVVMNIVLDFLFVGYMNFGVAGAAYATIISNFSSFLFGIWHINKSKTGFRIRLFTKNFDSKTLGEVVRLGVPAGMQNVIFSLGMIVVIRLVNSYGTDFIAGYNAAIKIDGLAFLPMTSFASAVTAYVGQNVGAGQLDRVRHGVRSALIINTITSAVLSTLVIILGPHLLNLFLDEYDAGVINAGMAYIYRIVPFLFLLGILFVFNCALRGAGSSIYPMFVTLISLILGRAPLAYFLADHFGRDALYYAWPLGWVVGLMLVIPMYFSGRWRDKASRIHGEKMLHIKERAEA
ncbi:MAG: MATE family efflux transporter [Eubacteriales bacterium]|nr:MATE family efflux transporter [Eubacteriales bacterium]